MKIRLAFIFLSTCIYYSQAQDQVYTASTPAATNVRSFLGISLTDSIDFIRWHLRLNDNRYAVQCQYGIGKPNTNEFINGGKKVEVKGMFKKEGNYYQLESATGMLGLVEWNNNLLHILDSKSDLLVGNGGWSYTLNRIAPILSDQINLTAKQTTLKDSVAFEGRTPCGIPGLVAPGQECYKLKWYIILYADDKTKNPGTYKILGTPFRNEGGKRGAWKMLTGKNNRIIYQLTDDTGKGFIFLTKLDENIIAFTDASGNLLVGDKDFSYTLNRRW